MTIRRGPVILLLCCLTSVGFIQTAVPSSNPGLDAVLRQHPDWLPDIPDNHWIFEDLQRLKRDGFFVSSPYGLGGHGRYTLGELSDEVHESYRTLMALSWREDGGDRVLKAMAGQDISAEVPKWEQIFERLLAKFPLGRTSTAREPEADPRVLLALGRILSNQELGSGANPQHIANTPDGRSVFEGIQKLTKDGLLVGIGGPMMTDEPNKYFSTIEVCAAFLQIKKLVGDVASSCHWIGRMPISTRSKVSFEHLTAELMGMKRLLLPESPSYLALITAVAPDLRRLGVDPTNLTHQCRNTMASLARCQVAKPGSALVQFKDVPNRHWAAAQVLELRRAGIVTGYPDGDFLP